MPQYTPQGITWQLYQTVALPYSDTAGPMIVDGESRVVTPTTPRCAPGGEPDPLPVLDFS